MYKVYLLLIYALQKYNYQHLYMIIDQITISLYTVYYLTPLTRNFFYVIYLCYVSRLTSIVFDLNSINMLSFFFRYTWPKIFTPAKNMLVSNHYIYFFT